MTPLLEAATLAWPCAITIACAVAIDRRREARRRTALNRALHELRRPLQTLALASSSSADRRRAVAPPAGHLDAAMAALAELDAEINGRPAPGAARRIDAGALLEEAVARWRGPAARLGREVDLRWRAADATVVGDPQALARALDNVVANSLEHGRGRLLIDGRAVGRWLRVTIADGDRDDGSAAAVERLDYRLRRHSSARDDPRRGHGLAIVAGVTAACGGRFAFSTRRAGALAVLELPLQAGPGASNGTGSRAA